MNADKAPSGAPAPDPSALALADERYRWTHGNRAPDKVFTARVECAVGQALVALGKVLAVEYVTDKGDGVFTWRHLFQPTRGEPPTLAYNLRTGRLHFVGGWYDMTAHGIEDHPVARGARRALRSDGDKELAQHASKAYEKLHGRPPEKVEGVAVACAGNSLAGLGPMVAIEWQDGPFVRRHEFSRERPPQLAFDSHTNVLHVVAGAYSVGPNGAENTMYEDDTYAVVANPSGGHPHMRDNPGVFLRRDELPAEQHDLQTVILGSLVAMGCGLVASIGVEYAIALLPPSFTMAWRAAGEVLAIGAGIWVACHYPVIGAAIIGGVGVSLAMRLADEWNVGPRQLEASATDAAPAVTTAADPGATRPAAGLPSGLFTPYPTGSFQEQRRAVG